jgi:hypothetical protein
MRAVSADIRLMRADIGAVSVDIGLMRADIGAVSADIGLMRADTGAVHVNMGAMLAYMGAMHVHKRAMLACLRAVQTYIGALDLGSRTGLANSVFISPQSGTDETSLAVFYAGRGGARFAVTGEEGGLALL